MAVTDLHVNGPAKVQVALDASSYQDVGYTEEGVTLKFTYHHEDVITDDYGPRMPADVQFMGGEARIDLDMIRWDASLMTSILGIIRSRTSNSAGTFQMADVGTLMMAGSQYMGLKIQSSQRTNLSVEPIHIFPYAFPVDGGEFRVGTKVTRARLSFRAITHDGVFYTRA